MKAVRKIQEGNGNLTCAQVPEPAVGPGMVKVKVAYCGICGSDMKFYHWTMRPGMNIPIPITFGHELSGVVCEVGEGVDDIRVGDRVVSETANVICGKCEYCISGDYLLCKNKKSIGYQTDGAMAQYICLRRPLIHKVPDNVPLKTAALSEPMCVAMRAVYDHARILPGDWVMVYGPGIIGQLSAQLARLCGARVIMVGTSADGKRLELAKELCAEHVWMADKDDIPQLVSQLTGGRGVDTVLECSGSHIAFNQAITVLRRQGSLVEVALFKVGDLPVGALNSMVNFEIRIQGSYGQRFHNWERAIKLMGSGALALEPLITHVFPLEEYDEAFRTVERMEGLKVMMRPNPDME